MRAVTTIQFKVGNGQKRKQFKHGNFSKSMSEELIKKCYIEHGLVIGNYEFYNIGDTTLKQLKKFKIIPNKDYKEYEARKPDGLLVDRRNKNKIKVILVIEDKDNGKFQNHKDQKSTVEQCNDLSQVLKAEV